MSPTSILPPRWRSGAAADSNAESNVALTFGGVGHFQRNPGKAFSTRQAGRAPAPVGEDGRRWSRPVAAHSPPPIGEGVDPRYSDETFARLLLLNTTRLAPDPQARGPLAAAVQHNARTRSVLMLFNTTRADAPSGRIKAPYRRSSASRVQFGSVAVGPPCHHVPKRLEYFAISCFAISQLLGNSNATACALRLISACPALGLLYSSVKYRSPTMTCARVRSCVPQGFIYTYTDYLVFCRCRLTSLHP